MLLRAILLAVLPALAVAQSPVLSFTRVPNPVTDGEANVILWSTNDTKTPVEITLQKGPVTDLETVMVLTKAGTGGQYIWTPSRSLADGTNYLLLIEQGNQNNTFGPFTVQGANPSAVASLSASLSAASNTTTTVTTTTTGGTISMGTGTTMHRNTTLVSPTLHTPKTTKTTHTTTKQTRPVASSSSHAAAAAVTAVASSGSQLALVLGAMAAVVYLG